MFIKKSKYLAIGIKAEELVTLAVDKDGFIQHPLDGIVGTNGVTTLASLIGEALGVVRSDEIEIPVEVINWCEVNKVANHIWESNVIV